ncbi:MAG: polysaccharide lyase [Beijerinckiaceae bacterium]
MKAQLLAMLLLLLGLASAAADPTRRLFDALEGKEFTTEGGLWYKENFEQSAGKLDFGAPVGPDGKPALLLSVKPHCPVERRGCSERAEIWEREELLLPYEAVAWYGFSMRLMEPIPLDDNRYVMAQWKRSIVPGAERDFSPLLALRMRGGLMFVTVETDEVITMPEGCRMNAAAAGTREGSGQTRALVALQPGAGPTDLPGFNDCTNWIRVIERGGTFPKVSSGWHDFVFGVKTGPRGGGFIEIIVDGEWIATVKGRIGHEGAGLGPTQYFKFGPYRDPAASDWAVAYRNFRRGVTCADAAELTLCDRIAATRE